MKTIKPRESAFWRTARRPPNHQLQEAVRGRCRHWVEGCWLLLEGRKWEREEERELRLWCQLSTRDLTLYCMYSVVLLRKLASPYYS